MVQYRLQQQPYKTVQVDHDVDPEEEELRKRALRLAILRLTLYSLITITCISAVFLFVPIRSYQPPVEEQIVAKYRNVLQTKPQRIDLASVREFQNDRAAASSLVDMDAPDAADDDDDEEEEFEQIGIENNENFNPKEEDESEKKLAELVRRKILDAIEAEKKKQEDGSIDEQKQQVPAHPLVEDQWAKRWREEITSVEIKFDEFVRRTRLDAMDAEKKKQEEGSMEVQKQHVPFYHKLIDPHPLVEDPWVMRKREQMEKFADINNHEDVSMPLDEESEENAEADQKYDVKIIDINKRMRIGGVRRATEETERVRACVVDYYESLGVKADGQLPAFQVFFAKIKAPFRRWQERAISSICRAQSMLVECLGKGIDEEPMLSVEGLMTEFGLKKIDAREYAGDLRVRQYQCDNIEEFKDHFACMDETSNKRKVDLTECSAKLRLNVDSGEQYCRNVDEYISCTRELMEDECGEEPANFMCSTIEEAMLFNYPECGSILQTCD